MLQRESIAKEPPTTALRRSPRFHPSETLDPKTPNPYQRRYRSLHSATISPLSSTPKGYVNSNVQLRKSEVSKKEKGSSVEAKIRVEPNSVLRRSARIFCRQESSSIASEFGKRTELGREFSCSAEKRVTRSSNRGKKDEAASKRGDKKSSDGIIECNVVKNLKGKVIVDDGKAKSGVKLSKELGKVAKRVTRGNKNGSKSGSAKGASDPSLDKGELLDEGKAKKGTKLSTPTLVEKAKKGDADKGKKQIGVKRKRGQNEDEGLVVKGWTNEQEMALQQAYFAAKPTPHFWKKVSKMVPGKTAQECFDKVHADHLTPLQAPRRSRAKNISPSPLSYSASKLLNSTEPKMKKCRYSKHNNHAAQKTVRHLLQKQYNVDQKEQTDLFAVLEATVDPSTGASQQCPIYSTPEHNKGGFSFLKKCPETSSSSPNRKNLSRLRISSGASLMSPPVLKQIKNKVLHEKYIDQLHCREAKRKAALARAAKQVKNKRGVEESLVAKLDAVKEAKSALYFEARDAISQFQLLQTNALDNSDHSDDDFPNSEDDEGEDGP